MLDKKNSKERKSYSTCSKFLGFNDLILNKELEMLSFIPNTPSHWVSSGTWGAKEIWVHITTYYFLLNQY